VAKSDTTFAISALAAKVQNIGQARVVLGATADLIRQGYDRLPDISSLAGLRDQFADSLGRVNAQAQDLYKIFQGATPDLYDQDISFQHAASIGLVLEHTRKILTEMEDAADVEWWNIVAVLQAALDSVVSAVQWTVKTAANTVALAATPLLAAFWPYLLVAGVLLVIYMSRGQIIERVFKK
jgi:lipid-A-disaccharide synthase-like uncharacterized protein